MKLNFTFSKTVLITSLCIVSNHLMSTAQVSIQINSQTAHRKPISPYIYGLNPYHYDGSITGMNLHDPGVNITSLRFGGDAVSTYNWEINSNTSYNGSCVPAMGYYTNDNNKYLAYATGQPSTAYNLKAGAALKAVSDANALNAYPLIQISVMSLVAADNTGCINSSECASAASSGRFKQVVITKPTALSLSPNLSDNTVYADEEVNYLISQAGNSATTNGIKGYCLENEPGIWSFTHKCAHALRTTCNEVLTKNIELAKRIKSLDAGAETFGPGAYGFAEFSQLNHVEGDPYPADWNTYKMSDVPSYNPAHYNHMTWLASYLRRMKMASDAHGSRLLDVLDLHFYSEGNNVLQDSRSFWDSTYVETSWITQYVIPGLPYNAVNNFKKLINNFYPGTKLAITEWGNFSNTGVADYGIYSADMLGAFGRNGVYLGNYFGRLKGFTAGAFKIFTNYNGANGKFGNTSVAATSADNSKVTAYAAIKGNAEDSLHLVLINRSNATQTVNVNLSTQSANYIYGKVYAMKGSGTGTIATESPITSISGNSFTYSLLPKSVYHIVLRADEGLGINPSITNDEITVYPNPAKQKIVIKGLYAHTQEVRCMMIDITGRTVYQSIITDENMEEVSLALPELQDGVYFLKIMADDAVITKKIVIRK